jgi:hypothetical protein
MIQAPLGREFDDFPNGLIRISELGGALMTNIAASTIFENDFIFPV